MVLFIDFFNIHSLYQNIHRMENIFFFFFTIYGDIYSVPYYGLCTKFQHAAGYCVYIRSDITCFYSKEFVSEFSPFGLDLNIILSLDVYEMIYIYSYFFMVNSLRI